MDFGSGMIFVGILALWAAYLVPHWLRRREQLAAIRSVSGMSTAIRVLARRGPAAGKSAGPQTGSTSLTRIARASLGAGARPHADGDVVGTPAVPAAGHRNGARPGIRPQGSRRASSAARRARVLAGLLLVTFAGWVVVAASPLGWELGLVPTALLAVYVALLVVTAPGRRSGAGRPAGSSRAAARAAGARPVASPVVEAAAAVSQENAEDTAADPGQAAVPAAEAVSPQERAAVPDAPAAQTVTPSGASLARVGPTGAVEVRRTLSGAEAQWVPVPVPPPTYTLKAKAPATLAWASAPAGQASPASSSGTPTDVSAGSLAAPSPPERPAGEPRRLDVDAVLERRRAASQ